MSGAQQAAPVTNVAAVKDPAAPANQPVQSAESRSYGKAAPEAETDIDTGTPVKAVGDLGADEDDASAATETDEDASDTEGDDADDTPDEEDESEEDAFEKRYKDTQAKLTETAEQLAQLRAERAESMAEITRTSYELQDRFEEQEQVAAFWNQFAQQDIQRLQQVNVQQLNQQQYAQFQMQARDTFQRAQMAQQALAQTLAKSKEHREKARQREASIARASLVEHIEKFDEVYPKLGQFAVDKGVDPQVFREITDPSLIKIIHEAMRLQSQPDVVKKSTQTRQTPPRRPAPNAKSRMVNATPKTQAQRLYKE